MDRYFHSELDALKSKLILMGEKSIEAVRGAIRCLVESDLGAIDGVLELDDAIDELEQQIDRESVRYITLRAPVSTDVRLIFVAIKASRDFERVGDEAHTIAKKTRSILNRDGRSKPAQPLRHMGDLAGAMLHDALACLIEEDAAKAREIIARDKEVDRLNRALIDSVSRSIDERRLPSATGVDLIFISKSLERIADHAKNLAEEVIFLLNGSPR
jgi:phosphate transport system protein